MREPRWTILRPLLWLAAVAGGIALAGPFGRKERKAEPPPPPATEPVAPAPEPTAPQAPPLFPDGLPVALQQTPEGLASLSAQSCNACHFEIHDDWAHSAHAQAWRSPTFQLAVSRAGDSTACKACHLPLANQHPQLAAGYHEGDLTRPNLQDNPTWDPALMSEGVTCAACHVRDGTVIGTHAAPGAPHPVAVSNELATSRSCATCHQLTWPKADQPFYDTYGEWSRSAYAKAGVRCQDCHMPPVAGAATATRFAALASHGFRDEPARALTVLIDVDGQQIQRGEAWSVKVHLLNTGAGHDVPTGSPFKTWRITVSLEDANGKALAKEYSYDLARKVADKAPWDTISDTRIPAGGQVDLQHSFTVDQRKHAGTAHLRVVLHRLGPSGEEIAGTEPTVLRDIPVPVL